MSARPNFAGDRNVSSSSSHLRGNACPCRNSNPGRQASNSQPPCNPWRARAGGRRRFAGSCGGRRLYCVCLAQEAGQGKEARRMSFVRAAGSPMARAAIGMQARQSIVENRLVRAASASVSRPLFFAALVAIGFANGISDKLYRSVADYGLATAISVTFDISIILWGACLAALVSLLSAPADPFRRSDWAIGFLAGLTFLAPVPAASWLGLCLIAVYLRATASHAAMRCAAAIVFALTLPLFWSRLVLAAFSDTILGIDAQLVGWLIGTTTTGNVVPLADGSGSMFIAPGCSSVANLVLTVVSATVFVNLRSGRWSPGDAHVDRSEHGCCRRDQPHTP